MYHIGDEFGFVAHPRCASRTTRDALVAVGAEPAAGHHQICEDRARDILQKGGFLACTTRNIFDLLVSWYFNQHINHKGEPLNPTKPVPTFERYLLDELIPKPKHRWFMTPMYHYGLPWCSRVMRYENLEADMRALFADLRLTPPVLGHEGKSIGKTHYRDYYSSVSRRAVEKRWAMDLHIGNYEF